YRVDKQHGLRIVDAWLKRPRESQPWMKVLGDVHVSQLYVPYGDDSNRFWDMDLRLHPEHGPWKLDKLVPDSASFLGPQARLLEDTYTVREERDAGLLWLFTDANFAMQNQTGKPRAGVTYANRRQEMVLWGIYQASNYFYVMQYAFQNDGGVV